MKLYCLPGACSMSDHIVLEWIGQPYDLHVLASGQQREPAYLAINPLGAVPALQLEDGKVLTENVAILNYLADHFPAAQLGGQGHEGRAEALRWLCMLNADVHPAFKPLLRPGQFIDDPDQQEILKRKAKEHLRGLFNVLDQRLADRAWLADTRSFADAYLFVMLRWAKGKQVGLQGLDHLEAFFQRMLADQGVQAAMRDEGIS